MHPNRIIAAMTFLFEISLRTMVVSPSYYSMCARSSSLLIGYSDAHDQLNGQVVTSGFLTKLKSMESRNKVCETDFYCKPLLLFSSPSRMQRGNKVVAYQHTEVYKPR